VVYARSIAKFGYRLRNADRLIGHLLPAMHEQDFCAQRCVHHSNVLSGVSLTAVGVQVGLVLLTDGATNSLRS